MEISNPINSWHGFITLRVISSDIQFPSHCDSYCKVSLFYNGDLIDSHKTRTVKATLTPHWNSTFSTLLHSLGPDPIDIEIEVYQKLDKEKDILIGSCNLRAFYNSDFIDGKLLEYKLERDTVKMGVIAFSLKYSIPGDSSVTVNVNQLVDLVKTLQNTEGGIVIKERKWLGKKYPDCFLGKELVDWLIFHRISENREAAVTIGKKLLDDDLIENITGNNFKDLNFLYRFKIHTEAIHDTPEGSHQLETWCWKQSKDPPSQYFRRWFVLDLSNMLISFINKNKQKTPEETNIPVVLNLNEVNYVIHTQFKYNKNNYPGIKLESLFSDTQFFFKDTETSDNVHSLLKTIVREKRPAGTITVQIYRTRNLSSTDESMIQSKIPSICQFELADWNKRAIGNKFKTESGVSWKNCLIDIPFKEDHRGLILSILHNDHIHGQCFIPIEGIPTQSNLTHWFGVSSKGHVTGAILLSLKINLAPNKYVNTTDMETEYQSESFTSFTHPTGHVRQQTLLRQQMIEDDIKNHKCGVIQLSYYFIEPTHFCEGILTVEVKQIQNIEFMENTDTIFVELKYTDHVYKTTSMIAQNAKWNQCFSFNIPVIKVRSDALMITVESEKGVILGGMYLLLRKLQRSKMVTDWYPLLKFAKSKLLHGSKLGQVYHQMNFRPKKPIILIPGFGGTAMKVEVSDTRSWIGERIWCSFTKLSAEFGKRAINRSLTNSDNLNAWIHHMSLKDDGVSDPEGVRVRPIAGFKGIDFLAPAKITAPLSAVFGPLIHNLQEIGYGKKNLIPFGYDWRLPPSYLEQRDGKLTELKNVIENAVEENEEKIVVVAHSMGNQIFRYFLNWLGDSAEDWCDKHIDTWVSVSAPWLGSPRALRSLISGYRFSLDSFLTKEEAVHMARNSGSIGLLLPVALKPFFGDSHHIYVTEGDNVKSVEPLHYLKDVLPNVYDIYSKWLQNDENYLKLLEPPPIKKMHCIYGINMETEIAGFYTSETEIKSTFRFHSLLKDFKNSHHLIPHFFPNTSSKRGLIFETRETEQVILEQTQGIKLPRSGDGTVPYASLYYPIHWKDHIPNLLFTEIEHCEHTETSRVEMLFTKIVEISCAQEITSHRNLEISENINFPKEIGSQKYDRKKIFLPAKELLEQLSKDQLLNVLEEISQEKLEKKDLVLLLSNLVADYPQLGDILREKSEKYGIKNDVPTGKSAAAFSALRSQATPTSPTSPTRANLKRTRNKRSLSTSPSLESTSEEKKLPISKSSLEAARDVKRLPISKSSRESSRDDKKLPISKSSREATRDDKSLPVSKSSRESARDGKNLPIIKTSLEPPEDKRVPVSKSASHREATRRESAREEKKIPKRNQLVELPPSQSSPHIKTAQRFHLHADSDPTIKIQKQKHKKHQ